MNRVELAAELRAMREREGDVEAQIRAVVEGLRRAGRTQPLGDVAGYEEPRVVPPAMQLLVERSLPILDEPIGGGV